jgi:hypothetical protein
MTITIGKVRSLLYGTARFLGDVQAVKKGRIAHRIVRRAVGRVTGGCSDGSCAEGEGPKMAILLGVLRTLGRLFLGWTAMLGFGAASLIVGLQFEQGRGILIPLVACAVLLLAFGVVARGILLWRFHDCVVNLIAAEATLLLVISHYSGDHGRALFSNLNLMWLRDLSPFVGLPWCAGFVVGDVWQRWCARPPAQAS